MRPDMTSKIAAEMEIKANLLVEGVNIEGEALEGVGTRYLEDISSVFGYYLESCGAQTMFPSDLKLPFGTVAKVSYNTRSPYLVRKEDGVLILEKEGRFVSTVEWPDRPQYYDKLTSDGVEMKKVGQIRGECALIFCLSTFCTNWKSGDQCRYCNINAAQDARKGTVMTQKKPHQVGEIAAAALEEGINFHLLLSSGGFIPEAKCVEMMCRVLGSVKEHSGFQGIIPGACVNLAAPLDLSGLDRLHQAGAQCAIIDLEVWNPHLFKTICPGKSRNLGRETWLRALEHAASVFGRSYVCSGFVLGLEEKDSYYEAAAYLAERGVFLLLMVWVPMAGSKLEGHRSPRAEWVLEVNEKAVDIMAERMPEILTEDFFRSGMVCCYRGSTIALFWDEIRRRLGGPEIVMEKDKAQKAAV